MAGWIRVTDTLVPVEQIKKIEVLNPGDGDHLKITTLDGGAYVSAAVYPDKAAALAAAQLVALGQFWE